MDCVTLMYAIAAASSPKRWTTGLTMLTLHLLRGAVTEIRQKDVLVRRRTTLQSWTNRSTVSHCLIGHGLLFFQFSKS